MTDEDLEQLSNLLNEHFIPALEKTMDAKIQDSVGGFANTVQGILNQQPAAGDETTTKEPVKAGPIEILAVLSPIAMQLLQTIGQMRATPQMDPKIWQDTFSTGMVFGVNAISVASRLREPIDGEAFKNAMFPNQNPTNQPAATPPSNGHTTVLSAEAFKTMATHGP